MQKLDFLKIRFKNYANLVLLLFVTNIAVGGWGLSTPLFGSKRRKFGQIVSLFGHTSGEKQSLFQ